MRLTIEQLAHWGYPVETLNLTPQPPTEAHAMPPVKKPQSTGKNALGQNKLEFAFSRRLADMEFNGQLKSHLFEAVKLRLAGNTNYTPDFLVVRNDGSIVFVEIKGFMRDDAAVKLKVAAETHSWADFVLIVKDKHAWDARRVTRTGIGRESIGDAWISR